MGPPGPPFRMSLIEPPEPHPRTFSEVLDSLGYGASPKLTLDELVEAFGDRGFGALILVLSLLALLPWPPGGKAVFAVPIALLSLELALQRDTVWLPRWALRASVPRDAYRALVSTPLAAPAWLGRLRGLIGRSLEAIVAAPALAALGDDVLLTAMGPGAEAFHGRMDNTRAFRVMATALGLAK